MIPPPEFDAEPRLIVSIHLAKTGGNTFSTLLERAATGVYFQRYGPDHPQTGMSLEGVRLTPVGKDNQNHAWGLFDRLLAVPSIAARTSVMQGHMNPNHLMERYPFADFVVWLRDPVDRVASHYEFWKRLDDDDFADPLYRRFHDEGMTLEEFAAEPRVQNTQTRTTGRRPIDDFAFVGITEHYDRSLELFGRMYDVDTGDIVQLNVNPDRAASRYEMSDATRAVVESHNQSDIELYRAALARFEHLDAVTPTPLRWRARRRALATRRWASRTLRRGAPDPGSDPTG
jgi:hypothetical protein